MDDTKIAGLSPRMFVASYSLPPLVILVALGLILGNVLFVMLGVLISAGSLASSTFVVKTVQRRQAEAEKDTIPRL